MDKTFRYHRYLFVMARKLPGVSIGIIGACWLPPLFLYLAVYHEFYMPLVRLALVGSLTVTFASLLIAMVLNELCNTLFIVSETSLVKKSPYKVRVIHFERAVAFRFVNIPLLKGFGLLSVPETAIRLPFLIDRLPECIAAIKNRLDAHAKQGTYDTANLRTFSERAGRYGKSIYRMQRTLSPLFHIALWTMVGSGFVAQVFWNAAFPRILCWAFIGMVIPLLGYLAAEIALNRLSSAQQTQTPEFLVDQSNDPESTVAERRVYRITAALTTLAYVAAGIVFKELIS